MPALESWVRDGRRACYWWWGTNQNRATLAMSGFANNGVSRYDQSGAWRIMRSQPHARFGVANGRPRRDSSVKVHMVRDQIVAKHAFHPEARMTRWLCGAFSFEAELRFEADQVCSKCLARYQNKTTEPLPREK